jgi:hypothetical protein
MLLHLKGGKPHVQGPGGKEAPKTIFCCEGQGWRIISGKVAMESLGNFIVFAPQFQVFPDYLFRVSPID